jgi:N-carbamoyl-L-amino-acid hydrolase
MSAAGIDGSLMGPDPERLSRIAYFVELHIEQGRGLADLDAPVGVGSAIWPHGRWRLEFAGRADHAGTTRMEDRHDPMVTFAHTALAITAEATQLGARSTFGRLSVIPNMTNAIPSRVTAWLDARARDQGTLDQIHRRVGPDVIVSNESLSPGVEFDSGLIDRIRTLLGAPPGLDTAAGHDAGILSAAGVPTAMLFVRNPTGTSHSPEESATIEDCRAGVDALATVLADLAGVA